MIQGLLQVRDCAVDLEDFVDTAGVAGARGADQADVEGAELRVPKPGVEEEVAAAEAVGGDGVGSGVGDVLEFEGEGGEDALVGVEEEEPGVFEGELEAEVALGAVVRKGRWWMWAPAAVARATVASVEWESRMWMSSEKLTERSAAGRS